PIDAEDVARAVTSLLVANHLASAAPGEKTFGAARASKEVNRALPRIFAGLLDGLLEAAVAARAASTASARKTVIGGPPGGLAPGKKIADYVVEQVLGSGGMGHCVLVRRRLEANQANARRWVLKLPQKEDYVEAFRNEALALLFLAKAGHPSIVRFVSYV